MDGYEIIQAIRLGVNIMNYVVLPLSISVLGVFAFEGIKGIKTLTNKKVVAA